MKEYKLGKASVLKFGSKVIISIDEKWCNLFEEKNPKFDIVINRDGIYTLCGPKLNLNPHRDHPITKREDLTDE